MSIMNLVLSEMDMQLLEQRINSLSDQGIQASEEPSGELNSNGCATGYCMAWA